MLWLPQLLYLRLLVLQGLNINFIILPGTGFSSCDTILLIKIVIMVVTTMTSNIIVVIQMIYVITMGTVPFLDISPTSAVTALQYLCSLPRLTLLMFRYQFASSIYCWSYCACCSCQSQRHCYASAATVAAFVSTDHDPAKTSHQVHYLCSYPTVILHFIMRYDQDDKRW